MGISLAVEDAPDATTLLRFRHLLEKHGITKRFFDAFHVVLKANGYIMTEGTIVDAAIIAAPTLTKNKDKARDPEMKPTKKGSNYHFGMKIHTGVDADSGFIHNVETTAVNIVDIIMAHKLLHGKEAFLYGDAGYVGIEKRDEFICPCVEFTDVESFDDESAGNTRYELSFQINKRRSTIKKLSDCRLTDEIRFHEKEKFRIRAKVELPFHIIKNIFKFKKTVYRGLKKNTARL